MTSPEQPPRRTRAFALTAGQYDGPEDAERITMHSLIRRAPGAAGENGALPEEWQEVLRWCTGSGIAAAEIAARLDMKLTPTATVIGELRDRGLVEHHPCHDGQTSIALLWRVRNALVNL